MQRRQARKFPDGSQFRIPYISEMRTLLVGADFLKKEDLMRRFKRHGKVKLFIISDFLRDSESRGLPVGLVMIFQSRQFRNTIANRNRNREELSYAS